MFRKLDFMSFKSWLLNGWYYVRFYALAYLSNYFKAPPINDTQKDGFYLVFNDEFNQPINWDKWGICEIWGCTRSTEEGKPPYIAYKPEQVTVEDGNAVMTTELNEQAKIYTEFESQTPEAGVKSGQLTTYKYFVQKYGYVETREKLPPDGINNWAAFWGYPADAWPPEIDVFELMGDDSSYITMTLHYGEWTTNKKQVDEILTEIYLKYNYGTFEIGGWSDSADDAIKFLQAKENWTAERQAFIDRLMPLRLVHSRSRRLKFPKKDFLAQGFHTYGCYWDENKIVWYIDNKAVYVLDRYVPQQPFYWLVTNAVKPYKDGETPPSTLPSKVYCDYFRAYRKVD